MPPLSGTRRSLTTLLALALIVTATLARADDSNRQNDNSQIVEPADLFADALLSNPDPAVDIPAVSVSIDTSQFAETALFQNNSAELTGEGLLSIQELFAHVALYKGITDISVTGHTSARGSAENNRVLSERRAATIARLLATRYPAAQPTVVGMGETQPIASNDTPEGEARNRRVVVKINATCRTFDPVTKC